MSLLRSGVRQLNYLLGNIDLELLDQLLKGRFPIDGELLDAGCGAGRNLTYFIRNGYQVYGVDRDKGSIKMLRYAAKSLDSQYPTARFAVGEVSELPYLDDKFQTVISVEALHFAENVQHFMSMVAELSRVLTRTGILFLKMNCLHGMEDQVQQLQDGKYLLPDGSVRFLITNALLEQLMSTNALISVEPPRLTLFGRERCICTAVLRKHLS
jgi:tellurite methyltransferase